MDLLDDMHYHPDCFQVFLDVSAKLGWRSHVKVPTSRYSPAEMKQPHRLVSSFWTCKRKRPQLNQVSLLDGSSGAQTALSSHRLNSIWWSTRSTKQEGEAATHQHQPTSQIGSRIKLWTCWMTCTIIQTVSRAIWTQVLGPVCCLWSGSCPSNQILTRHVLFCHSISWPFSSCSSFRPRQSAHLLVVHLPQRLNLPCSSIGARLCP